MSAIKQEQLEELAAIVEKYRGKEGSLIPVLQEAQGLFNYLPEQALSAIGKGLRMPLSKVYGVVTFYSQFCLNPRGKYIIKVCRGTACHVKGANQVLLAIENTIGLKDGETSADFRFTLETVACLGACALAPVMMINDDYFGQMTQERAKTILRQYEEEGSDEE